MSGSARVALLPGRGIVAVAGRDRASFLQGLVTNDIRRLAPDRALYAGLLTPQGKLLCDFFLIEDGTRILIDVAAPEAAALARKLSLYKLRAAVEITDLTGTLMLAALWGEDAAARAGLDPPEGAAGRSRLPGAEYAFVDPRLAALGVRALFPARSLAMDALGALGFSSADPADYADHRLRLGIGDTAEIGGEVCYPLEANFEALHGVDFRKGCYIGQELTARMKLRGALRKRVLPVTGADVLPGAGTPVTAGETELGPLIAASGTQGLALLRLDRLAEAGIGTIRADHVPLSVHWPSWLPR